MNDADELLKLQNQICFPLYACAKEVVKRYKPFLDPFDLTYTQYITMMVLWESKQISVKALGERLYLDSGTMTPVLKRLEQKGYLTRERCREDERSITVSITEKGEALKADVAEVPLKLGACVKLERQEAQELYRLLYQVLQGLNP
jgi:DNA-binding MarR family transcriptional regulator